MPESWASRYYFYVLFSSLRIASGRFQHQKYHLLPIQTRTYGLHLVTNFCP